MTKKILLWTAVSILLFLLAFFSILFQEYRPIDFSRLSIEHVRNRNLTGDFIYPSAQTDLPVVVFLGGSGGGLGHEEELKSLALHGYAVLSLAYFKEAGLPDKLENIPLEYFENAFNWLKTKTQIDTSKLLLLGVSRGAELALLLGSTYPQIKGVIAYSPSCFVIPNATEVEKDTLTASWTIGNKPVPFAQIPKFQEDNSVAINYRKYIDPLLEETDLAEKYTIKVEEINGPVLLISGEQDLVWPASKMSARIKERLIKQGFKHKFSCIAYKNGGHDLLMFKDCYPIISSIVFRKIKLNIRGEEYEFNLGGTVWGVINSKIQSRSRTLQFLEAFKNATDKL